MKKIELSGIIKYEYLSSFESIKLIQEDGYKIDLVGRINEATESYNSNKVQVNYYLSNNPCPKEDILKGFLKTLYGNIDASYEANGYAYSEMTTGTDYDTNLSIGGHDLFNELRKEEGRFIIIELNF